MKKTRISLAIILALLLTFCLSTVSYADTKETAPQPVSEQQGIVVPMGIPCEDCGIGTMIVTQTYSPYTYSDSYICDIHNRCTVVVYERTVLTTRKCNYCSAGGTTTVIQQKKEHKSTL